MQCNLRRVGIACIDESQALHAVTVLASAEDAATGMADVVTLVRRLSGAARVEWWAPDDDDMLRLAASAGSGKGLVHLFPLGRDGEVAVFGGECDELLEATLAALAPVLRRRRSEERLADAAVRLAQRNSALEDFAALVAHELKSPLHAALVADEPTAPIEQALDLVESLLDAARNEARGGAAASVAGLVDELAAEFDAVEISVDPSASFPIPVAQLRVILRNLIRNAVAAGARTVRVATDELSGSFRLVVDDDGVGLADARRYAAGSGVGLRLSRRISSRFGGTLELAPRPAGGTRAELVLAEAA